MTEPSVSIEAFLPFYTHILPWDRFRRSLAPEVQGVVAAEDHEAMVRRLWEVVVGTVEGHSYRTLIGEFHQHRQTRGLPPTADSDTALTSFSELLRDERRRTELLARYPVLERRLDGVTRNMLDSYREMLRAYRADRHALAETFGLTAGETITAVEPSGSDPHNDNRSVMFVSTSGGHHLVFKPRPLTADDFARDLYRAASAHLAHSLERCVPDSLSRTDHGWQRFTRAEPMGSAGQPARYFYRFGALTCLFSAIGATDLHDENLLAHGEYPCVIDTETLLRADAGVDNDTLSNTLINHMKNSVTSTMLLPMVNPDAVIDVMVSGVGVLGEQQSQMRKPEVVDGTTDAIRVEWNGFSYSHSINVPRLGETELAVTDYFPDMMSGYRDALEFLRGGGTDQVLAAYPDLPVRCVLRTTEVYARYLDASTHPKYLGSQSETDRLFGHLHRFPRKLHEEQAAWLSRSESGALDSGNIPYFLTRGSSTELATHAAAVDGFFKVSALDNARRGVRMARERHERYHQFLVEECLGDLTSTPQGLSEHGVFAGEKLATAAPGTWGLRIAEVIEDLAVHVDRPDGSQAGWIGSIGPDRGAATMTPGNYISFHDMGGIPRLFRTAARADERFAPLRDAADRGLAALAQDYPHTLANIPESAFSGLASVLPARPHAVDEAWLDALVHELEQRGEKLEADVANGPAGVLMLLLSRAEQGLPHHRRHLDAVRRLAFRPDRPAPDGTAMELAHGELGLYWAKARTGRVLGDEHLSREAFDWLTAHLEQYEPPVIGWCKGAAGVLLAAGEICRAAGRTDWLVGGPLPELVQAATALEEGPVELSVCHGTSGVVQALLAAAAFTGDAGLVDRARHYQGRVIALARRRGFYTGAAGRSSLLGYMLGWSGTADTDLMLAAPGLPHGIPAALTC
ncbi:type 2 lanthipeptide synthetase LanM [Streptomyces sp. TLI_185]|uniref:type 2 lanthipeptide synthetase LanM n=1 Tax=Streptomyces sp. TLI_185 TaxID=2485151 RepID=UPI000F4D6FE1|nr:type 2 lanthipeptide synthetase LanM [Streptomyces sp. TLI_185]RPF34481.1 type 2 lantibiotic biosynthesis protein LanM [Streptomyces sp. TLI_185]